MTGPAPWLRRLRENADRVRDAPLEPLAERLARQRPEGVRHHGEERSLYFLVYLVGGLVRDP